MQTTTMQTLEPRRLFFVGGIDPTYGGGDGVVDVQVNARGWAPVDTDVAVDASGRALIAGVYGGKKNQFSVARVTAAGAADATFGDGGFATAKLPLDRSGDVQVVVDGRGRTLVMVATTRGATITRLTASGAIDKKFGKNGTAAVPIVSSAADLAVDAGNNVFVVGTAQGKTGTRGAVVRLDYRGRLDKGFGSGGAYKTPVPQSAELKEPGNAVGRGVTVTSDGKIVGVADVAYRASDDGTDNRGGIFAFRLNANGTLDPTYGPGGARTIELRSDEYHFYRYDFAGFDATGTGAVLTARVLRTDPEMGGRETRGLARLGADGRKLVADLVALPHYDGTLADLRLAAQQPDGKVLARDNGTLYRTLPDGRFDDTFDPTELPGDVLVASPTRLLLTTRGTGATFSVTAITA